MPDTTLNNTLEHYIACQSNSNRSKIQKHARVLLIALTSKQQRTITGRPFHVLKFWKDTTYEDMLLFDETR